MTTLEKTIVTYTDFAPCGGSTLATVLAYDENTRTANIEFKDGAAWSYSDVPLDVWLSWKHASSIGGFYHSNIRGRYASEYLGEDLDIAYRPVANPAVVEEPALISVTATANFETTLVELADLVNKVSAALDADVEVKFTVNA